MLRATHQPTRPIATPSRQPTRQNAAITSNHTRRAEQDWNVPLSEPNRAIVETIYRDDTRFSSAITLAPPYFDIQNNWNKAFRISKLGKPIRLVVAIQNVGNSGARGKATVRVFASPNLTASGTLLVSQQIRVGLFAGKKGSIAVSFKLPAGLPIAFHPAVDVELTGDGNLKNNTAASTITY